MGNRYSIWHEMNVHGTYFNIFNNTASNFNFNDIVSSPSLQVCQSSARYLQTTANSGGGDFVVHFGQIFPIQILQLPETLSLQVRKKINQDTIKMM